MIVLTGWDWDRWAHTRKPSTCLWRWAASLPQENFGFCCIWVKNAWQFSTLCIWVFLRWKTLSFCGRNSFLRCGLWLICLVRCCLLQKMIEWSGKPVNLVIGDYMWNKNKAKQNMHLSNSRSSVSNREIHLKPTWTVCCFVINVTFKITHISNRPSKETQFLLELK